MGFDLDFVISDARYHGIFVCAICQNLVDADDALVTTVCSHCFCRNCLQQWLELQQDASRQPQQQHHHQRQAGPVALNCPTCNRNLEYSSNSTGTTNSRPNTNDVDAASSADRDRRHYMMMGEYACLVQPLKSYQPLAYRLLRSLLVRCPLAQKSNTADGGTDPSRRSIGCACSWTGDYGDVQSHLVSATAHATTATSGDGTNAPAVHDRQSNGESSNSTFAANVKRPRTTASEKVGLEEVEEQSNNADTSDDRNARKLQQQQSLAKSLKEEANNKFVNHQFAQALPLYSRAIDVLQCKQDDSEYYQYLLQGKGGTDGDTPSSISSELHNAQRDAAVLLSTLFCNRATAHLKIQHYSECINDCDSAIEWNPLYGKAHLRKSRAYVQIGDFERAMQCLQLAIDRFTAAEKQNPNSDHETHSNQSADAAILQQQSMQKELRIVTRYRNTFQDGIQQLQHHQYAAAKSTFGALMKKSIMAPCVLLGTAKADLGLGLTDAALTMTMRVLRTNSRNAEACQVRGQALFLMGDYEHGLKLMKEGLRLDPESTSIKHAVRNARQIHDCIQTATRNIFHRKFQEAADQLTEALKICVPNPSRSPLYASLHTQRAEAYLRLKKYAECLKDCSLVVYAQEGHIPAWLIKFQAYHGLGQHEDALNEVSDLLQRFESSDMRLRKAYEKADFLLRKQRRADYYGMLGVPSLASLMEIKKAYKQKCLQYHPDRHSQKSQAEQQEAERNFKILGDALETLSDDFKRKLYDEGYDPAAIRERVEAAEQAARRGYNGRGGGGHHHGHGHY